MPELTEEEADALDEYWTAHIPKTGPNGTGFISRRNARLLGLDNLTMDYIWTRAEAGHKSPAQIIGELVREKISAAAEHTTPEAIIGALVRKEILRTA